MGSRDEIVLIVDEQNRVVGAVPRWEMRARRLPHRSTHILVFNSRGELYVQKRARTKDAFPGCYDPVAGGVVLAEESYEESAQRELGEELGIRGVPLTRLFDFYYADERARVWGRAFSCVHDGEVVLQEEEIESGAFMRVDEVLRLAETEPVTPDGLLVLRRHLGLDWRPAGSTRAAVSVATVEQFVRGLCAIPEREFTVSRVAADVASTRVDPESLAPYLFYTPTHYTRNLIYKCDLFELLAICWEVGQISRIHNHQGQNCWMAVPIGRLAVQNYELVRVDEQTRFCELRPTSRQVMDPEHPAHVDPEMPIHAVLNLPEYGERATSLHVYSRPYDRCLVYSLEKQSYQEVPLFYDSEYGRPAAGRDGPQGDRDRE